MAELDEKSIIIAGNGPSLAFIDYRRYPYSAKVFRLNNFFFEDKYYVGKDVDYYMCDLGYLEGMYFNLYNLNENGEYNIKDIYITNLTKEIQNEYPLANDAMEVVFKEKKFEVLYKFYMKYYQIMPSGGLFAIFLSIVLGYKKIFLIGIDMYSTNLLYPWKIGEYFSSLYPRDKESNVQNVIDRYHPKDFQIKVIRFLQKEFPDIQLYSLSEESPINEYIELAPILDETLVYEPTIRPESAQKDWFPLPEILPQVCEEVIEQPENVIEDEDTPPEPEIQIVEPSFLQRIFSVKNEAEHKVLRVLGIKMKFRKRG